MSADGAGPRPSLLAADIGDEPISLANLPALPRRMQELLILDAKTEIRAHSAACQDLSRMISAETDLLAKAKLYEIMERTSEKGLRVVEQSLDIALSFSPEDDVKTSLGDGHSPRCAKNRGGDGDMGTSKLILRLHQTALENQRTFVESMTKCIAASGRQEQPAGAPLMGMNIRGDNVTIQHGPVAPDQQRVVDAGLAELDRELGIPE